MCVVEEKKNGSGATLENTSHELMFVETAGGYILLFFLLLYTCVIFHMYEKLLYKYFISPMYYVNFFSIKPHASFKFLATPPSNKNMLNIFYFFF